MTFRKGKVLSFSISHGVVNSQMLGLEATRLPRLSHLSTNVLGSQGPALPVALDSYSSWDEGYIHLTYKPQGRNVFLSEVGCASPWLDYLLGLILSFVPPLDCFPSIWTGAMTVLYFSSFLPGFSCVPSEFSKY